MKRMVHSACMATMLVAAACGSAFAAGDAIDVEARRMTAQFERMQDVQGRYQLNDGRLLQVKQLDNKVMVRLDGEASVALRGKDLQSLRSADGRMALRFVPGAFTGDVDVVVTLYGANQKVAQVLTSASGG